MRANAGAPDFIPKTGWLQAVRQTLGQSQAQVAGKIGVRRQAYAGFESGEVRSTISLGSLRRAAEAMDCELVYFLRPKAGASAPQMVPSLASASEHKTSAENFVLQLENSAEELPVQLL